MNPFTGVADLKIDRQAIYRNGKYQEKRLYLEWEAPNKRYYIQKQEVASKDVKEKDGHYQEKKKSYIYRNGIRVKKSGFIQKQKVPRKEAIFRDGKYQMIL